MMRLNKVTNIALDICKIRDVLETKDYEWIYKNLYYIRKLEIDLKRHIGKYTKEPAYELDFMVEDIEVLSDLALEIVQNLQHRFSFKKLSKLFNQHEVITSEIYKSIMDDIAMLMKIDTELRAFYKDLAHLALVFGIWQKSDDKKTFEQSLIDTLRSFI